MVIYALYKKTTFEGTSYVLNLDANGGMIEDEFVKKYDYLGADDMAMPVFHYIPQRSGYRFKGWNSKKDGSGKTYQLISSESWRKDNGDDLEKDVLLDNERYYKYVTLYALWEKNPIHRMYRRKTKLRLFRVPEEVWSWNCQRMKNILLKWL